MSTQLQDAINAIVNPPILLGGISANPIELVQSLDEELIKQALERISDIQSALVVLLRAARRMKRK